MTNNKCCEVKEVKILKIKDAESFLINDIVVDEISIALTLQCELLGSFTCTPSYLEELVSGYLITSGIVTDKNRIVNLDFIENKAKFDVTLENNNILKENKYKVMRPTGCAGGDMLFIRKPKHTKIKKQISVMASEISELMQTFNKTSELFIATGGVHSAAIADNKNILVFREDIGRHNAVDKAIGNMYLNKMTLEDKILLSSGRISSEIVQKAINAGIQIVISRSAPTLKGIELAEENGLTIIGFARSQNFNIYSHFFRVVFE